LALGYATLALIAYGSPASGTLEMLLLPGAFVGMLVAPGRVHGDRPMLWAYAVAVGNFLFYAAMWFFLLGRIGTWTHRSRPQ